MSLHVVKTMRYGTNGFVCTCRNNHKEDSWQWKGNIKRKTSFPDYIKEEKVLRKQNDICTDCNKILNVVNWDHIGGDRSNNKESNCQALCPNCHVMKTVEETNKQARTEVDR